MINIRIENKEYSVPQGVTVLEAARNAGYNIPTLCNKEGLPHYSSCMVCIIKDKRNNTYLPSCSALAREGMDIDLYGTETIEIRKKSLELLLSEHRADCEAPCRLVCPSDYNIPLMNRLLAAGNYSAAIGLVSAEVSEENLKCSDCKAYCQNACKRKKIDSPISIRNIRLFILRKLRSDRTFIDNLQHNSETEKIKSFSSKTGKLMPGEINEWLKEYVEKGQRHEEISEFTSAEEESKSCMHCDCRAAKSCSLRKLASELQVKDRQKITGVPIIKKINSKTGLIFESAKCIKCGLCIRVSEDSTKNISLCFINRGMETLISEPLGYNFADISFEQSKKIVEICPTGALSFLNDEISE
jgi:predicted molibdopterin-dependent oxidoreductase YjgC